MKGMKRNLERNPEDVFSKNARTFQDVICLVHEAMHDQAFCFYMDLL
jgi:hypothetical protein